MGRLILLSTPEKLLRFHHESFPLWLQQAGIDITETVPQEAVDDLTIEYLHALYPHLYADHPYVFLWGPRGEILRDNLLLIRDWLNEDEYGGLRRSRIFEMLKYCADLPLAAQYNDTKKKRNHSLQLLGDFADHMYEIELSSPVMNGIAKGSWESIALVKDLKLDKKPLYDQVVQHRFFRDMHKVLYSKTSHADDGFLWWARFVLAGPQQWENPDLIELQEQHIAFCQAHGLQP